MIRFKLNIDHIKIKGKVDETQNCTIYTANLNLIDSFAAEYKTLQTCVDNIEKDYPGQIMSMEVESENGVVSYEFDIDTTLMALIFLSKLNAMPQRVS